MYEFYNKEMASKAAINTRSALSWSTKKTVLTQEVIRVLLNCSKLLPWQKVVQNVNKTILRMQYSGYSEKLRYDVVNSALKAVTSTQRVEERGMRLRKSEEEKQLVQERWKRGSNLCTIYTKFTATEEIPERNKQQGFKVKVVEKAGVAMKKLLQRSHPFKSQKCDWKWGLIGERGGKGLCDRQSMTYDIKMCRV